MREDLVVPSGLRGGGTTHLLLQGWDIPALRRRGRWSSERTLERYLHEGVVALAQQLPALSASVLDELASLAGDSFGG